MAQTVAYCSGHVNSVEAVNDPMPTDPLQLPAPPAPRRLAALTGRLKGQPATVEWVGTDGARQTERYGGYDATLEIARQLEYLALGRADRILLDDGGIVDGPLLRREIEG